MVSDKVVIKNPTGLHLRPAGLFCKTAMQYKSKITVYKKMKNEEVNANAKSVLSVLGACIKYSVRCGHIDINIIDKKLFICAFCSFFGHNFVVK